MNEADIKRAANLLDRRETIRSAIGQIDGYLKTQLEKLSWSLDMRHCCKSEELVAAAQEGVRTFLTKQLKAVENELEKMGVNL